MADMVIRNIRSGQEATLSELEQQIVAWALYVSEDLTAVDGPALQEIAKKWAYVQQGDNEE